MDETDVRTMLRGLADTVDGSARIDLPLAAQQGRRSRRWRQMRISGSLLAMGAAIGLIAAVLVVPGHRPVGVAPAVPAPLSAPAAFNPLVLYASFGWLPTGYVRGTKGQTFDSSGPSQLELFAWKGHSPMTLEVYPAGACTLARGSLSCPFVKGGLPVAGSAPKVNGRQALWLRGDFLSWQYAPGAWSVLDWGAGVPAVPGASEEATVMHVATTVRYGESTPLEFPYWMPRPPAKWGSYQIEFTERSGRNLALVTNWTERPAAAGGPMLQVVVMPEIPGDTCPAVNATERRVTLDGASAVLEDLGGTPGNPDVCAADVKGWTVGVGVVAYGKPTLSLSTVMDYARALRLHTADPAEWTTDPFR
jgi:hypothetical protein